MVNRLLLENTRTRRKRNINQHWNVEHRQNTPFQRSRNRNNTHITGFSSSFSTMRMPARIVLSRFASISTISSRLLVTIGASSA